MKQILYLSLMYAAVIHTAEQEPTNTKQKESIDDMRQRAKEEITKELEEKYGPSLEKTRKTFLELSETIESYKKSSDDLRHDQEKTEIAVVNVFEKQISKIKQLKTTNKTLEARLERTTNTLQAKIQALEAQVLALQQQSTLEATPQTQSTIGPETKFPYLKLLIDSSTTENL